MKANFFSQSSPPHLWVVFRKRGIKSKTFFNFICGRQEARIFLIRLNPTPKHACTIFLSASSPPPTFQKRDIFLLLTKDTQLCIVFLFCKLGKVISFSPPSSNVCETECVRESVRARVCVRTSRSEVWVEGCHLLQLQSYGKRIKLYSPSIQSYEDIQHFPSHSL